MKFVVTLVVITAAFIGLVAFNGTGRKTQDKTSDAPATSLSSLVGKPAPYFTLQSYDGKSYELNQFRGKKVVLFFNEGITCYPACWNQMVALGKDPKLNSAETITLSIVPDTKSEWVEAIRKMPELGAETILLDTGMAVSNKYGVLNLGSPMHRGSKPGHTYIIVDAQGIIRYTKDDANMGVNNDVLVAESAKL